MINKLFLLNSKRRHQASVERLQLSKVVAQQATSSVSQSAPDFDLNCFLKNVKSFYLKFFQFTCS